MAYGMAEVFVGSNRYHRGSLKSMTKPYTQTAASRAPGVDLVFAMMFFNQGLLSLLQSDRLRPVRRPSLKARRQPSLFQKFARARDSSRDSCDPPCQGGEQEKKLSLILDPYKAGAGIVCRRPVVRRRSSPNTVRLGISRTPIMTTSPCSPLARGRTLPIVQHDIHPSRRLQRISWKHNGVTNGEEYAS